MPSDSSDCDDSQVVTNSCKKNNDNSKWWKVLIIVAIIVLILVAIYLIIKFAMYSKIFSALKKAQCSLMNAKSHWGDVRSSMMNEFAAWRSMMYPTM